ncbi:MAG: Holliday junction branch migration protein RuvA [Verrucomicrobia bacterium]|jgi:Holliday junction DNA helicase RuvA|nr:Holliday junction branch migration protein RuvA [Verrucomicrobiota bacterium]
MISFIEGTVEQAGPLHCVLNCNGVGYRVEIPVTTAEKLPAAGKTVRLHVQPVYREDHQALYGFASAEERDFFHLVTSRVSGIGPKIGLNLLSRLSFAMLRSAIASGDAALIAKCPGIGKKTAERVCIELKDKIGRPGESAPATAERSPANAPVPVEGAASSFADAVQALMTLGFKLDAADKAVRKAQGDLGAEAGADALIKAALRSG